MKEALRTAGIPCAQSTRARSAQDARDFADAVGYPLIIKPRAGAGASGTKRVEDDEGLERAIQANAQILEKSLASFRIETRVVGYTRGPVITMFELALNLGLLEEARPGVGPPPGIVMLPTNCRPAIICAYT